MLNWFARRLAQTGKRVGREEKGFTLIELLVVVIIIGILAAIAIPIFLNQRAGAQDRAAESNVRSAAAAQQAYRTDNNSYATTISAIQPFGFNQGEPTVSIDAASTGADTFCVEAASASGTDFSMTESTGAPRDGVAC